MNIKRTVKTVQLDSKKLHSKLDEYQNVSIYSISEKIFMWLSLQKKYYKSFVRTGREIIFVEERNLTFL